MYTICSAESSPQQQSNQREVSTVSKEAQQLIAEVDEKKRRILREVEVCVATDIVLTTVCGSACLLLMIDRIG